ncbi:SDR family NAD(P)-dependent oxidoreductase, partial [Rhodococcus ruber]|uniref:SDR family NAD(P)-dependent oxidoreductase n=1 Tax=Rhodococcus ruber TaxID=1830 RepID=UPI000AC1CFC1
MRPSALITGGSRGVGAAIARELAPSHDLLLGGRRAESLRAICAELPQAAPWPVDLLDHAAVAAACSGIDRLDVLVHSAGLAELGTIADGGIAQWREMFEANVVAGGGLTRLLLPALRAADGPVGLLNSGAGPRVQAGPRIEQHDMAVRGPQRRQEQPRQFHHRHHVRLEHLPPLRDSAVG